MPYFTEVKPLTHQDLAGLVNWLATKHPDAVYEKNNMSNCLVAQFIRAQGRNGVICGKTTVSYRIGLNHYNFTIPEQVQLIAYDNYFSDLSESEDTYGNALQRAKQLLNMWAT